MFKLDGIWRNEGGNGEIWREVNNPPHNLKVTGSNPDPATIIAP